MMSLKKPLFVLLGWLVTLNAFAQAGVENGSVAMADTLRADGKIYVVVAVAALVLVGLLLYLVRLDRRVTRMENTLDGNDPTP